MLQYWVSVAKAVNGINVIEMEALMNNNAQVLSNGEVKQKWYQKHKKKIIMVGGIVVVTAAAGVAVWALFRNERHIVDAAVNVIGNEAFKSAESIIKCATPTPPVHVEGYLRKLPDGYHSSKAQLELAKSLGIEIPDSYTYVREYIKHGSMLNIA